MTITSIESSLPHIGGMSSKVWRLGWFEKLRKFARQGGRTSQTHSPPPHTPCWDTEVTEKHQITQDYPPTQKNIHNFECSVPLNTPNFLLGMKKV